MVMYGHDDYDEDDYDYDDYDYEPSKDTPGAAKTLMNWPQAVGFGIGGFGATLLLNVAAALVLHQEIDKSLIVFYGLIIGLSYVMAGRVITAWPSRLREWAGVLALTAGASWVLGFIDPVPPIIMADSSSLVITFLMVMPFFVFAVGEWANRPRKTKSSPVPSWHPDNLN